MANPEPQVSPEIDALIETLVRASYHLGAVVCNIGSTVDNLNTAEDAEIAARAELNLAIAALAQPSLADLEERRAWDIPSSGVYPPTLPKEPSEALSRLQFELAYMENSIRATAPSRCRESMVGIHARLQATLKMFEEDAAYAVDAAPQKVHVPMSTEGTFQCTCHSYPHTPDCGWVDPAPLVHPDALAALEREAEARCLEYEADILERWTPQSDPIGPLHAAGMGFAYKTTALYFRERAARVRSGQDQPRAALEKEGTP